VTPATVSRFLEALRAVGCEPIPSGRGFASRCPAHDDRRPSLRIDAGGDGRALVYCYAGCPLEAICTAAGVRPSELFADPRPGPIGFRNARRPPTPKTPSVVEPSGVSVYDRAIYPTAAVAVADLERRHGRRSSSWTYRDATGEPVGVVVRWDGPEGKSIRPVSLRHDRAGWFLGGMPPPRPLYALPELLAACPGRAVHVAEGEKAADAARACGLVATTSPHGALAAGKADWSPLRGRRVVVLPDNDAAGMTYAASVADLARAAGAVSVSRVELSQLWPDCPACGPVPEGGDLADLLACRGGDLEAIRGEVEALGGGSHR
jgi:hypothetical protein